MGISSILYRYLRDDHNVAAEIVDTDNSGCVDIDGGEGKVLMVSDLLQAEAAAKVLGSM